MRWAITGGNGMLAADLVAILQGAGESVQAFSRAQVDVTSYAACVELVQQADVVVNCAAWTAVDDAEQYEAEAFEVNAVGASFLAQAAHAVGTRLVHVSTDYVFSGDAQEPYASDALCSPVSAYGRTKLAGEWAVRAASPEHLIVRTAWLYGHKGASFPRTIARLARERGAVQVVSDQVGQPTWSRDLADLIIRLVVAQAPGGIYHGTSSGVASWFEFAQAVVAAAGMDPGIVKPLSSSEFVRPAVRPQYSVLAHDSLERVGVAAIGAWDARWRIAGPQVLGGLDLE